MLSSPLLHSAGKPAQYSTLLAFKRSTNKLQPQLALCQQHFAKTRPCQLLHNLNSTYRHSKHCMQCTCGHTHCNTVSSDRRSDVQAQPCLPCTPFSCLVLAWTASKPRSQHAQPTKRVLTATSCAQRMPVHCCTTHIHTRIRFQHPAARSYNRSASIT